MSVPDPDKDYTSETAMIIGFFITLIVVIIIALVGGSR